MYKVIIVEDEDIIRRGLKFHMDWAQVGCSVIAEASSGEEGLKLIEQLQPDIVITDIRMQGISGIEMLKQSMKLVNHKAIILSGYADFEHAKEAISLGVVEYLLKPIDFDELTRVINKIIESDIKKDDDHRRKLLDGVKELPVIEPSSVKNEYARKMLDYIMENYADKISITDLSEELYVSSTHLNVKFKAETGYTFHDFLNYYRIVKAVELQKEGKLKLYEIGEAVGIPDYKYFNKVYKKYVGHAPNKLFEEANKNIYTDK